MTISENLQVFRQMVISKGQVDDYPTKTFNLIAC